MAIGKPVSTVVDWEIDHFSLDALIYLILFLTFFPPLFPQICLKLTGEKKQAAQAKSIR